MTATDMTQPTGEERLRSRRRKFARYCLLAFAVALVAGMASGYIGALVAQGTLPRGLIYGTTAVFLLAFTWFTRDYLRRVDEFDLLDNLWAGLIGFYVFFAGFPIWNSLHQFGLAPPVDNWLLWGGTTTAMFLAYFVRKLGLR